MEQGQFAKEVRLTHPAYEGLGNELGSSERSGFRGLTAVGTVAPMSTGGGSLPGWPSDDATVVRYGQKEVPPGLIVAAVALSVATVGLSGAALVGNEVAR
jgi:hypothetical protein